MTRASQRHALVRRGGPRSRLWLLAPLAAALLVSACGGSSGKSGSSQPAASSAASSSREAASATASSSQTAASASAGSSQPAAGAASGAVALAAAICTRRNAQVRAVAVTARNVNDAEVMRLSAKEIPIERATLAELRRLVLPASMLGDWRRLLAYRQLLVEKLTKLGEYAKRGDQQAMTAVLESSNSTEARLLQVQPSGLPQCAVLESIK